MEAENILNLAVSYPAPQMTLNCVRLRNSAKIVVLGPHFVPAFDYAP